MAPSEPQNHSEYYANALPGPPRPPIPEMGEELWGNSLLGAATADPSFLISATPDRLFGNQPSAQLRQPYLDLAAHKL